MASTIKVTDIAYPGSANTAITINANDSVSMNGGVISPQTGFKNRIINGGMTIDQRNAGASVTPTTVQYTLDRWQAIVSVTSKFSVQQNAGAVTPPAGFTNYLGVTSLSAYSVGASETFAVSQLIEGFNVSDLGWGTASAQSVTLSFWVRSSLTGTFGGSVRNSVPDRSYPFTYTISAANTWEQKTVTIAGDTSGTWLTTSGVGIQVIFGLGSGTTRSGTAGVWAATNYSNATGATSVVGTSGATFYVTGVQLEKGSTATPFEFRSIGQELALCQRYLPAFLGTGNWFGFGIAKSTTQAYATVQFPVPVRVAPTGITVSAAADFNVSDAVAVNAAASVVAFNTAGTQTALLLATASSATLTSLRPTTLLSNSANAKLLFTGCEL